MKSEGETVGQIGRGLNILLAIGEKDTEAQAEYLVMLAKVLYCEAGDLMEKAE